ncbi:hypothetical protein K431DRAFT_141108 [Polychaeton citri CBS 116435]|uniref:Uncharacterized protein n=1 Tax=Polychaeton citri CBS 116435 TaxID=1314669 RepID=A0A9P4UM88_9PEZI|nr:hypothetical protein K431DRAFT_141108 [Polychaeton citri CBS 116435]
MSGTKQFNIDELKTIGMQCGGRLPPASAVQAMFLYEMQRQTETEKLFEGAMFALARDGDKLSGHSGRLANVEDQIEELKRQKTQSDVAARVQIGKVRLDAFQVSLNQCVVGMGAIRERLQAIEEGSASMEHEDSTTDSAADSTAACGKQEKSSSSEDVYADTALWCDIKELNTNIDVLFDERDAMVKYLDGVSERQKQQYEKQEAFNQQIINRLDQLERLVKQGTHDCTSAARLGRAVLEQSTESGKTGFSPDLLENYKPVTSVNEFIPGKPWTS